MTLHLSQTYPLNVVNTDIHKLRSCSNSPLDWPQVLLWGLKKGRMEMRPLFAFILSCDKQELESRVDEAVSPSVLRFALFIFASRKKRKEKKMLFSSFDEKYLFFFLSCLHLISVSMSDHRGKKRKGPFGSFFHKYGILRPLFLGIGPFWIENVPNLPDSTERR